MQVVRKDIDALNLTLEVTLLPEDYTPKFDSEIKKYKKEAQIKGFRKGQVPDSTIKKMYGKSIMVEVLNDMMQKTLFGYIDENKLKYLGQPLPNEEEQNNFVLSINDPKEYKLSFDLGISAELDIKGIAETDTYDFYDVTIPEDLVDKEVDAARRRLGKQEDAIDTIQVMDMVELKAVELDGDSPKDNGWESTFSVLVDIVKDEKTKAELLTKKMGDSIVFDVYELEGKGKEATEKYILKKTENDDLEIGNMFRGEIVKVSRIALAPLDEEFFTYFGSDEVKDEESVRAFLKRDIKKYYDDQATNYMNRDILDRLVETNKVELPESFLKRYLIASNEGVNEEVLETEFKPFADNLRWTLQKAQLSEMYEIKIEEEDLRRHFNNTVFSYMRNYGNMDYSFISQTVDKLMKDQEQVNKAIDEIQAERLFNRIGSTVQKNLIPTTVEYFTEKVKALNERLNNFGN